MRVRPGECQAASCAVRLRATASEGVRAPMMPTHRRSSQVDERGHLWHHRLLTGRRARAHDPGGLGRGAEPQDEPVVVDRRAAPRGVDRVARRARGQDRGRDARRAADASLLRGPRSSGSRQPRGCLRAASACRRCDKRPWRRSLHHCPSRITGDIRAKSSMTGERIARARAPDSTSGASDARTGRRWPSGRRRLLGRVDLDRRGQPHEPWSHVHEHPPVACAVPHRRSSTADAAAGCSTPHAGRRRA